MKTYVVNFTDVNTSPIYVDEQTVDTTSTDLSLFGYIRLKYGEHLQENLLHLLENYACPEDTLDPGNPDLSRSVGNILEAPVMGQFWYNTTTELLNQWVGDRWVPLRSTDDVAANWGGIGDGQQLPRPVSPTTGYVFEYEECIWSVAPAGIETNFTNMRCYTDQLDSTVTMDYEPSGNPGQSIPGVVNYLIIGIRGNKNLGSAPAPTPEVTGTLAVTPTVTPTIDITPTVTPTGTPVATPSPTTTPASSPEVIGLNTRLYTSPSPGDPGGPGPGGVDTQLYSTCEYSGYSLFNPSGRNDTQYTEVQQPYYLSLQDIDGGIGPYTVSFRWVTLGPISGWWNDTGAPVSKFNIAPYMHFEVAYSGGTGATNDYLRTGIDATMLPRMVITPVFNDPQWFSNTYSYNIQYNISGYVLLTDSNGASQRWYVPPLPTDVGGSNEHNDGGWFHTVSYQHIYDCYECTTCR